MTNAPKRVVDDRHLANPGSIRRDTGFAANRSQTSGRYKFLESTSKRVDGPIKYLNASTSTKMATERELTDAKLESIEARTETRFVELNGKIDRLTEAMTTLVGSIGETRSEVKADNKFTRWSIIIAVATSVLAGAGLILTTQSTLLTAFQTGLTAKPEAKTSSTQP